MHNLDLAKTDASVPSVMPNYMRTIILFILLLSTTIIVGQKDSVPDKVCVKIAPLALLDIYSGMSPRIGVEYKLKDNYSLHNEIGTYIPNANGMTNNRGYLAKLEFKAYLNKQKYALGPYVSAELFYKHQSYGTYDSMSVSQIKYLKNYSVEKNVTCFTLKVGVLGQLDNGIIFEPFAGFGIRHRDIASTLTSDENNNIIQDGPNQTNIIKNKAGVFNVLNFDMGVKIGYRIK